MKILAKSSLFCLCGLVLLSARAQHPAAATWRELADVKITTRATGNVEIQIPVFGTKVRALAGKSILLRGYVLPMELDQPKHVMFSMLPYSQCFFCGGGGPETVVEVYAKTVLKPQSKPITLRGRLRLNPDDYTELMYILEDAEVVND